MVSHDGCKLNIKGLVLAIDCDHCLAFDQGATRPDLAILRYQSNTFEWIVVEVKAKQQFKAVKQIEAGLKRMTASNSFGDVCKCRVSVVFAHKKGVRTADIGQLREPLPVCGRKIIPKTARCGTSI